jgi:uncharacterized protein YbjQ (UPF0145 family)
MKKYSLILATILFFWGCKSAEEITKRKDEKARVKIEKIGAKRPNALNDVCRKKFDGTDSTNTNTVYLQGEDVVVGSDTVTVHDTVNNEVVKYITKTVKTTDTFRQTVYERVVNKAQEEYLQTMWDREKQYRAADKEAYHKERVKDKDKISKLEQKNATQAKWLRILSGILIGIFLGACVWLYLKFRNKVKIP